MKPPRIPPFVTDIVQTALSSLDGLEFADGGTCPACGGTLSGYDRKTKKFAVLREPAGDRVITVRVKRFICRHCGALRYADEPFYPGTRIGSPVVDLFTALSAAMPPHKAARVIGALGIVVNRTTWRNYTLRHPGTVPVVDVFGVQLPLCIVRLSDIAIRSGESDPIRAADVIDACGNPSRRKGAGQPVDESRQGNNSGES